MPKSIETTENQETITHSINARYSGIQFVDSKQKDPNGSQTPKDKSFTIWQNSWGSFIRQQAGNIIGRALGNVSLDAGDEIHISGHKKQEVITDGAAIFIKGTSVNNHGDNTDEQKALMQQYKDHMDAVSEASKKAIKSTPAEKTQCPNCAQQHLVDDKSDPWTVILRRVKDLIGNIPFYALPFKTIQWLIQNVYCALLGVKSNNSLAKNNSCGPGCVNGQKDGMSAKLQAGASAASTELAQRSDDLKRIEQLLGDTSVKVEPHVHGYMGVYGNPTVPKHSPYITMDSHHSIPTNLRVSDVLRNKLYVTTEGNPKQVVYQPPPHLPFGNLTFNVENKFSLTAGNAGADILSTGEVTIRAGSVHINGSQGEVSLTSGNLTTIGGKMVYISADDGSGDSGVCIDSKYTYARGAFNVNGDASFNGHVTIDGGLTCTHFTYPTMAVPTDLASTSKWASEGANWQFFGAALNMSNFAKDLVLKYGVGLLLETEAGLLSLAMEMFNIIMMDTVVEILPTGFAIGICPVGPVFCVPPVGGVWNWRHNHTLAGHDHDHEYDAPAGIMHTEHLGVGNHRVAGNPAPTPAPTATQYPRPGPKAWSGGCGGGGLFAKIRNQRYGINSEDAYNGTNTVQTTTKRNSDGSIYPFPISTWTLNNLPSGGSIDPNTGYFTPAQTLSGVDCTPIES
jgi:hypothetical protein